MTHPSADQPAPVGRSIATYTLLRVALAAAVFGLCVLAGLAVPISLVLAFAVSSVAALLLLRRQRDELADGLVARRRARLDAKQRRRAALGDEQPG